MLSLILFVYVMLESVPLLHAKLALVSLTILLAVLLALGPWLSAEDTTSNEHGGGRRRRTIPEKDEDGGGRARLFLLNRYKSSFTLRNPAIREVLQVPDCPYRHHSGICYVGFGFSPIVNDYKIVRYSLSGLDDDRVLVQVFSVSTRSWKEVEVEKLKGLPM
ncbi:hypothetical protein K1719_018326 [Acacia pycnantha]|nr:hypothetical protein K1719_018326 [Acacia pycnantha]